MMIKSVSIIINAANKRWRSIRKDFETQFAKSDLSWDINLTQKEGDAYQFAKEAVEQNRDCVCVCGGDGTIKEAVQSLKETEIPLAIFHGGTGNVLANELKTEHNIKRGCQKILKGDFSFRKIDVGECNDQSFLVRVSGGYEAELVKSAPRNLKTQVGWLAYAFGGVKAILKTRPTHYFIECEGVQEEYEGLSFVVANSTNLGIPGVNFWPFSRIDDGLLDFFIIRKTDIERLLSFDLRKSEKELVKEFFIYKSIREMTIKTDPLQETHCDGDLIGGNQFNFKINPKALKILSLR